MMRGFRRSVQKACVVLILAGGCQANPALPAGGSQPAQVESPVASATTFTATSSPSGAETVGCDPIDEVFANLFVGLSEAALSNARIAPEEFFAALAGDRKALKRYLEVLGLPFDDASIDVALSSSLAQRLLRRGLDAGSPAPSASKWVLCD
jgi:hypothetical protein